MGSACTGTRTCTGLCSCAEGCSWLRSSPHTLPTLTAVWKVPGPSTSPASGLPVRDFGVISQGAPGKARSCALATGVFRADPSAIPRRSDWQSGDVTVVASARKAAGLAAARSWPAGGPRRGCGEARGDFRTLPHDGRRHRAPQFRAIGSPVGRAALRLATGRATCRSRTAQGASAPR